MSRLRQKLLWCSWLGVLSTLPLSAQTDSVTTTQNVSQTERIAVLDISGAELNRKQSLAFVQAFTNACREEPHFLMTAENVLAPYLKKRRQFSIFVSDSVRALCKSLALDYLIVSSVERATATEQTHVNGVWQITLRWLDGSTGQITKIHTSEYQGDLNAPDSFPLRELLSGLLDSPDIIVPVDNGPSDLPALAVSLPEINAPTADSINTILPNYQTPNKHGRSWWWYFTGAALVSGGSAALLLRSPAKSGSTGKVLLPEPPDPPK